MGEENQRQRIFKFQNEYCSLTTKLLALSINKTQKKIFEVSSKITF